MHYPPVAAADARKSLIHRELQESFQENLLKDRNKGNRESNGLLLPFSSLMPLLSLVTEKQNPLRYSSYFTHVRSMPSAGERQALFELSVWSLKFEEWSCPSFRADLDRREREVEKSFYAGPHAETAETAETPVISSAAERSREILSRRSIAKKQQKQRKLPSFRAQRSGVEKSFHAEALRREKKSHTDYTDFHRNSSPTTDYARKRADYTEPRSGVVTQKEQKQWKLPSFRAQRSGVEKSFHAEALRREKKSHTDSADNADFPVLRQ